MFIDAHILTCTEPEYRAIPAWSYSSWKLVDKPEYFKGLFVRKPPIYQIDETSDMLLGTNIHAEFLEGHKCQQAPEWALTTDGKRFGKKWDAFKAGHPAIECLSAKEYAVVQGLRESILAQPKIASLLWGKGSSEVKIQAVHERTGITVRGMLDKVRWIGEDYVIADFKASNVDPTDNYGMSKRIDDFRYHWQAAAYCDLGTAVYGRPPLDYLFVWAHKDPPYIVRVKPLEPRAIQLGREENEDALCELARRLGSDDWFGEGHNEVMESPIDVPDYCYRQHAPTLRDFIGIPLDAESQQPQGESDA